MKFNAALILLGIAAACGVHGQEGTPTSNTHREVQVERRLHQDPFDIVFLIDESGSMHTEMEYFKNNVGTVFDALNNIAPGSKAGLVGFGNGVTADHATEAHVHTVLTDDPNDFQDAANELTTEGPNEPTCACIYDAVSKLGMGFRKGRDFCTVVISDEQSNHDGDITQEKAINALNNIEKNDAEAKGIFIGILPVGSIADSFEPFKTGTNGEIYSLADFQNQPEDILTDVISFCSHAVDKVNIVLGPHLVVYPVGTPVEFTAYVTRSASGGGLEGIQGEQVTFRTLCGVDEGATFTAVTNENGEASVSIDASSVGINLLEACFQHDAVTKCSNIVMAEWPQGLRTNTPPTARCKNVTVDSDTDCQACAFADVFNDGSSDLEDNDANLDTQVDPGCPYSLGTTQVTLTVTDSGGLSDTCDATVTVTNNCTANTPPTARCRDVTAIANATTGKACVYAYGVNNGSTDPEDEASTLDLQLTPPAGCDFSVGTTQVQLKVTDSSGEFDTCDATVVVRQDFRVEDGTGIVSAGNTGGTSGKVASLFEGDTLLTYAQAVAQFGEEFAQSLEEDGFLFLDLGDADDDPGRDLAARIDWRWPTRHPDGYAEIAYSFDTVTIPPTDRGRRNAVREALNRLEKSGVLKFVERPADPYVLEFAITNVTTCSCSVVGCLSFLPPAQSVINLGWCKSINELGSIMHEVFHALGFWHEHSRPDRDSFITVTSPAGAPQEHNWRKRLNTEVDSLGSDYDFASFMHYPDQAFSGQFTFTVNKPPLPACLRDTGKADIGQRDGPSWEDIEQLRLKYACESGARSGPIPVADYCTTDCPCWENANGNCNSDDECQGDLICTDAIDPGLEGWVCEPTTKELPQKMCRKKPTNVPPTALCKDSITVNSNANGEANVDADNIDNGSFDPDGDDAALDFQLTPAGPYRVGTTVVTLTVTDSDGESDTCTSRIEVIPVPPPNVPPTAVCKSSITVNANTNDEANVSAEDINDDSHDPDGDDTALEFELTPAGPYPIGTTVVTLTVTDLSGESDTCTSSVVVVGAQEPTIRCNAPEFSAPLSQTTTYTATATGSPVTLEITWDDCYRVANGYFKYKANSNIITRSGPSITIGSSTTIGDHMEWLVEATDGTGQVWEHTCKMAIVADPSQWGYLRRRRETTMLL